MYALRTISLGVIRLLRWIAFEFLPLRAEARAFRVLGTVCRLAGCGVALGILSVELRESATARGAMLVLVWAGSALTAILIGNFAKEWAFELCSRLVTLSGHTFCRTGVTLGGKAFLEVHYPRGIWLRCEFGPTGSVYEWNDANDRCNRVETEPCPDTSQSAYTLWPVIRVNKVPHEGALPVQRQRGG